LLLGHALLQSKKFDAALDVHLATWLKQMAPFKGAKIAGIGSFREFPDAVANLPPEMKDAPIVSFCTGGIRCEKAAPFMEREGFKHVWQLEGGILKYFDTAAPNHHADEEASVFPRLRQAVLGRAELMARVRETWISSTLATEFVALAAARAVLDVWDGTDVAATIAEVGERLMDGLRFLGVRGRFEVAGLPEMFFLRFADEEDERRTLLGAAEHGVLLKRGAYNFPSLAHGPADVAPTLAAVAALTKLERTQ
jgi:hypothetical protein